MQCLSKIRQWFMLALIGLFFSCVLSPAFAASPNYGEALQKSIFFYDIQRLGKLSAATGVLANRVYWRGDSFLQDYALPNTEGVIDLGGGFADAGDNVKFNFPMAASMTLLAWGVVDFQNAYTQSGQLQAILANLRWGTDYLLKCWDAKNSRLYGQVSPDSVSAEHSALWMPFEVVDQASIDKKLPRYGYYVDVVHPGTDLAGETVAALAASSLAFKATDPVYAQTLLNTAKAIYNTLVNVPTKGKYSENMGRVSDGGWLKADVALFYNSWSGYEDEVAWSAMWLYRATQDPTYLAVAEKYVPFGNTISTLSWDDKSYGTYLLMAKFLPSTNANQLKAKQSAQAWLDAWSKGSTDHIFSAGGLAIASALAPWGNARYAATTAFGALLYDTYFSVNTYDAFAKKQIDYILGVNPKNQSFICGMGPNFPKNPHHATAQGRWSGNNDVQHPEDNRHIAYGGLVGGPKDANDTWVDDRNDYIGNEVALDYNAGFTGALAALYAEYGGATLPASQFPPTAVLENPPADQIFTNGSVQSAQSSGGTSSIQVSLLATNHSAWPARVSKNLAVRYFLNLADKPAGGTVAVSTYSTDARAVISPLTLFDAAKQIYYVEVWFKDIPIYPGGDERSISSKETQLQFRFSWNHDYTKDWSYAGLGSNNVYKSVKNVPVYEVNNGRYTLLYGTEPASVPQGNLTLSFPSGVPAQCLGGTDSLILSSGDKPQFTLGNTAFTYTMPVGGPYTAALGSATQPILVTGGICKGTLSANTVSVPGNLSASYLFTPTPAPDQGTLQLTVATASDAKCTGAVDTLYVDGSLTGSTFTLPAGLNKTLLTGNHTLKLASETGIAVTGGQCQSTLSVSQVTIVKNTTSTVTVTYRYQAAPATGTLRLSVATGSDTRCANAADTLYLDGSTTGTGFTVSNGVSRVVATGLHTVALASANAIPAGGGQTGTCTSTLSAAQAMITANQTSTLTVTYQYKGTTGGTCMLVTPTITSIPMWDVKVDIFQVGVKFSGFPVDGSGNVVMNGTLLMKNNVRQIWADQGLSFTTTNKTVGIAGKMYANTGAGTFNLQGFLNDGTPVAMKVGDNPVESLVMNGVICGQ